MEIIKNKESVESIVTKEVTEKLIATLRFDFNDGGMFTSWSKRKYFKEAVEKGLDLKLIDKETDDILTNFKNFEDVVSACNGMHWEEQKYFCSQGKQCIYGIKLTPLRSEYNYIFVFWREKDENKTD